MKKIIFLISLIIVTLVQKNTLYAIDNKIIVKIDNDIITSLDIKKETRYLLNLNPKTKNLSKDEIYNLSKTSLIREKIKEKEILKNFEIMSVEQETLQQFIVNIYKKIDLNSEEEFLKLLKENNLSIDYVLKKIQIEILWNRLIYLKYKSSVKIDPEKIKNNLLVNKKMTRKNYFLQEIIFNLEKNENLENKFTKIQKSINYQGFEKTALIYSISDSSKNNGNVGWISENSLNKNILNEIKKINVGEYSKPIIIPGGFLLLKIKDIKIKEEELNVKNELLKIIQNKTNQQLNQFSLIFFNKLKKNLEINEL